MQEDQIVLGRVHYVDGKALYYSQGRRIYGVENLGSRGVLVCAIPDRPAQALFSQPRLIARLLRKGVHHLLNLGPSLVVVANGKTYCVKEGVPRFIGRLHGSRPLVLCQSYNSVFYGEYRGNSERSPVHVWRWQPGQAGWKAVWQFDQVRHIHGVFRDPYTDSLWVTTGDEDAEAGIWRTDDNFRTMEQVAGGSQQFRAVQLLFTPDFIYFGSDAPDENNHIYRIPSGGGSPEKLTAVGSSVFHGCKVGDSLFFSTAVEPSSVNTTRCTEVWRSDDGVTWRKVLEFKKDIWSMKYFQYGQVLFPLGPGDNKHLYITPFATEEHGKTLVYRIA